MTTTQRFLRRCDQFHGGLEGATKFHSGLEGATKFRDGLWSKEIQLLQKMKDPIVWIDCEMTGLNLETDHIIEIAVLITDGDLNIIAEGPDLIIHQPQAVMETMNAWCIEQHGKSGLTKAVLESSITTKEAQQKVLEFIELHLPNLKGRVPLAGNSVHADKRFLEKEMPLIVDYLHYRIIDVSTVKELTRRWYPSVTTSLMKKNEHRALDDIKESIEELKYYRQHVFVQPS